MKHIPLITSLPKTISRPGPNGTDNGKLYSLDCIKSWLRAGFAPISVNSRTEMENNDLNPEWVRYITVKRDARRATGKPLVFLKDILQVAGEVTCGPIALTNADILLDNPQEIQALIRSIKPGRCFVGKRLDIDSLTTRNGIEHPYGYDFFAFHSRDIQYYSESEFIFGMPWWDHFFPLFMAVHGIKILPISTPFVFHLTHHERWDEGLRVKYGIKFLDIMRQELKAADFKANAVNQYAREFYAVATDLSITSRMKYTLRCARNGRETHISTLLHRLSAANVKMIDEEMVKNTDILQIDNAG